jgi:prepilin peptidase CpaA
MIDNDTIYFTAGSACAVIAACFDIKSRRVPNLLTGPAFVLALAMHLAFGGWRDLFGALFAGLVCGILFFLFYLAGGMGAGDVKLMTAAGAFVGMAQFPILLVFTTLIGGGMAVGLAVLHGRLHSLLFNTTTIMKHHFKEGLQPHPELNVRNADQLHLPYAVAIAVGCLLTQWSHGIQGSI